MHAVCFSFHGSISVVKTDQMKETGRPPGLMGFGTSNDFSIYRGNSLKIHRPESASTPSKPRCSPPRQSSPGYLCLHSIYRCIFINELPVCLCSACWLAWLAYLAYLACLSRWLVLLACLACLLGLAMHHLGCLLPRGFCCCFFLSLSLSLSSGGPSSSSSSQGGCCDHRAGGAWRVT
jgi:hypothetical protein